MQHRHLASVPRHESPTRVAHYRRKIPSPRKAAIRLMQRPRYTSEVERDARAARMVGKCEVEAAAAIESGGSCERMEVFQPGHALHPESRGAIERGQRYPKVDGAIGKVVHAIHVWPDRGLLFH